MRLILLLREQVLVDGQESSEEDLRFEVLHQRLCLAVPNGRIPPGMTQPILMNGIGSHARNGSGGSSGGDAHSAGDLHASLLSSQIKKEE